MKVTAIVAPVFGLVSVHQKGRGNEALSFSAMLAEPYGIFRVIPAVHEQRLRLMGKRRSEGTGGQVRRIA